MICGCGPWPLVVPQSLAASERLNIEADVLEAQLAHAKRDEIQKAYDRTKFDDARRIAMQKWADYLDKLRAIGPVEHRKAA